MKLIEIVLGVLIVVVILFALYMLGQQAQDGTIATPKFKTIWTTNGPITVFGESEWGGDE